MCGIFGYTGFRTDAADLIFKGLKTLEYRGYDSWGVAVMPKGSQKSEFRSQKSKRHPIIIKKKAGKIGNATVDDLPISNFGLGHTRWATHGGVTQRNAHPHLDCSGKIVLVHNGIIENYEELRRLLRPGHRFRSQTDTEVAVHLIEELAETLPFREAVRQAFLRFTGLNALIVMNPQSQTFVAARNGSPLVAGFGKSENLIASDAPALLPHTKTVYFLEDNDLTVIGKDRIEVFAATTGKPKRIKTRRLTWSIKQAEKGKFPYFMLKEIAEQPALLVDIAHSGLSQAKINARRIGRARDTYLLGCGSAAYAGIAGAYFFSTIAGRQINPVIGSEFAYLTDFLTPKSLVIALSQSGETMDTLEAVKAAKAKGAKILAVVNVLGSTLYREADFKILIGAGPEKAVATTKAFTGKLAHLLLLAYSLAGKAKIGRSLLLKAARVSQHVLTDRYTAKIHSIAGKLKKARHIYVIGRGLSYPASLETALKIKEISYIHAEGFAAGELKHGVIALVEKGTPCIAFLPNDETYGANLAGAMEMKARGGRIIGISYKPHGVFDDYLSVPDIAEATIIPNIIVAQRLAYELAVSRNLDPDMPRNLAKSVTVK